MPNWCGNVLSVNGPEADVYRWVEEAASWKSADPQPLHFSAFLPPPPNLQGRELVFWRIENWGTKWEPEITDFTREEGHAQYRFDTAWGPPLDWFLLVTKRYPTLSFCLFYIEEDMDFAGEVVVDNGEVSEKTETTVAEFFEEE